MVVQLVMAQAAAAAVATMAAAPEVETGVLAAVAALHILAEFLEVFTLMVLKQETVRLLLPGQRFLVVFLQLELQ